MATKFVEGFDRQTFKADIRSVYAVTRCLEIISEASRRSPADLKARYPAIAWKQMAGAGNVYRHDCEDVAAQFVWDTVERALPPLRTVVEQEIARLIR
ncbi:HepT-like ribonuclease domain-containing protein [Bradyrhizobium sp. LTSP885]|uniref:HepT-like ribonuclease domain-containing protein n=1 Tax=Bradyrhizobium sp. LTSP885 TaxID=1619232 RepID=UPI000AA4D469|nr:HepT-like ribonuclease domain-containing protein [Bradyrhizobium sp. LTSP885]